MWRLDSAVCTERGHADAATEHIDGPAICRCASGCSSHCSGAWVRAHFQFLSFCFSVYVNCAFIESFFFAYRACMCVCVSVCLTPLCVCTYVCLDVHAQAVGGWHTVHAVLLDAGGCTAPHYAARGAMVHSRPDDRHFARARTYGGRSSTCVYM